ncbi:MAG TPA: hypothetical protein VG734_26940 [Lacunisphaera sp.]|nr:hypothetical protein [Lacunisphaera sp.]
MSGEAPKPVARQGEKLLTAILALTIGGLVWGMMCTAPGIPWNGARLAPSFALARGLPLYALRDTGAHLGWVYGPVFPLWYLPMGLTDNPTLGLMLASWWNAVTIVAPLWLVTRVAAAGAAGVARFMTALGTILLLADPITRSAFLFMHVDAVSMGWAIVACVALHAAAVRDWRPGLPLAAIAVALSVAAKQVSVVLVPATFAWLWADGHRRLLGRWIFWLAAGCGGLAAVFFTVFGAEGMLFNAWLLFSRMPWQGGWDILWRNVSETVASGWLWLLTAAAAAVAVRFRWRGQVVPEAAALARLLVWLALWQLPMGLMASMVVDAALNSIHATNYLMIAGLVAVASVLAKGENTVANRLWRALAGVAVIGVGAALLPVRNAGMVWTPYRGQEELIKLARQHQGKIYLPWNPLTTVITERKIYPFDEALHYLWLARLEPPRDAIIAAVPAGATIIYQEPAQSHFALRYFEKKVAAPAPSMPLGPPTQGE